jgi:hypothetical protein
MKFILVLCLAIFSSALSGAESRIELNADEVISLARFEVLYKLACENDDVGLYPLLFSMKGRDNLSHLSKMELAESLRQHPEVLSISMLEELTAEGYTKAVGEKMANRWIDKDGPGVRFFKVNLTLQNNGSAPSYIILKGGVFYKAVQ